ncbi:gluconate 2-dehydrogenase subunit 3 family protein [Ascidiimonas sp. W6]|uniref:gluconate 2-dehydrogenase subunit 3 family protein n=1 Tax=Ascidiimonas meishanensis TaxID=3128903 RepID=UPI0030ED6C4B
MERRDALKRIGLSMGYVVATPTILSILQSCKNEPKWVPINFSQEEGNIIYDLVDIIIPKTDTPGATELNVPQFIDIFIHDVFRENGLKVFNDSKNAFMKKIREATKQEEITEVAPDVLTSMLDKYLKISKEQEIELGLKIGLHTNEEDRTSSLEKPALTEEDLTYNFLSTIRGLAIWGFKESEYIGEEVLAYKPIPGEQKGCVDLKETTGGKAWSI